MANADTLKGLLDAIGDAIRAKTGGSAKLTLAEMPDEIAGIGGGAVDASYLRKPILAEVVYATTDAEFGELQDLISRLDTSGVTSFANMFKGARIYCPNVFPLKTLSFPLDTSSAKSMASMFESFGLGVFNSNSYIVLSSFNTSRVTSFAKMFSNAALWEVDISSFDTRAGTNFTEMFGTTSDVVSLRKIVTGSSWSQAGATSDAARATFPGAYVDENSTSYAAGAIIPDGAHTYTKA